MLERMALSLSLAPATTVAGASPRHSVRVVKVF